MTAQNRKSGRVLAFYAAAIVLLVLLDQWTKWLAIFHLKGQNSWILIPGVFELRYLENQSAAFGMDPVSLLDRIFHFKYFLNHPEAFLQVKMIFFVVLTITIVVLLTFLFVRIPENKHFRLMNLGMVLFVAGAVGNFIDRVCRNFVVDFFYFSMIDFPIFNVADIYVTVSAFGLMVLAFFYYKEEDFEYIFPSLKKEKDKK